MPSFLGPLRFVEPLPPGALRRLLGWLEPAVPSLLSPPALFVGTPFEPYEQTSLLAGETPEILTDRVRRAGEGLAVAVLTNVHAGAVDGPRWRRLGWRLFPSFPDMVVDLSPPDLDAHLRRLPAGDRSGIRRNLRRFERAGHRLERAADARFVADALYRCYLPMRERAVVEWFAHTPEYFARLTELGPQVRLTLARDRRDRVIGFVVGFDDTSGVQAGRIGVHPDYHRKDAVYFRLLYDVLDDALRRFGPGKVLSLEPTSFRMKRHLGARRVPLVNALLGLHDRWSIVVEQLGDAGARLLSPLEDPARLDRWA